MRKGKGFTLIELFEVIAVIVVASRSTVSEGIWEIPVN